MARERVALIFGGRSVEHRVSVVSARAVAAALGEAGFQVVPVGIDPDGVWVGTDLGTRALIGEIDAFPSTGETVAASVSRLAEARPEVAFPLVHGTWGEDGTLQGLLEMMDLPYVGAGVTASALAMDKILAKRQLAAEGLPVVDSVATSRRGFGEDPEGFVTSAAELGSPLFVKPAVGGSSVGVRKVEDPGEIRRAVEFALRFDDRILVERGVEGRELEASVLGLMRLEAAEAIGEIRPGREFYDYQDKYVTDGAELIAPAELPPAVARRLRQTAVEAFRALGGTGMARVDFLLEGEEDLFVNEINTLPGFTEISMYPKLWQLSGLPMPELATRLVGIAKERHEARHRLDRGIEEWLASL